MSLPRCIRTRLLEALWTETKNCFARDELGLAEAYGGSAPRIYAHPLKPGDSITPRQINIVTVPINFTEGTGGVTDSVYEYEILFTFPIQTIYYTPGENSYLCEIDALRYWLYAGGSVPNRNGRLADPDNPGAKINNNIVRWAEGGWRVAPGNAGVEVPVVISFETREDATGGRA
ncbi:MAG TPA: hypothetical protein VLC46_16430 [Thermoanaerobaculia bacterium]|jgi:hypothetical protein|nr:hypothetical protein [Thermoanaerobaculia bacterium]